MPIAPQPVRIRCRQCDWSTVFAPQSDALVEPPPESCEQCGSTELTHDSMSMLDTLSRAVSVLLSGKPR